jgi:hypothetical protein
VIALVIAALVFGLASVVAGPKRSPQFMLTSGTSFAITSTIYPSPACSGTPALLYPGTTRCDVFTVHSNLSAPITVTGITTVLNSSYQAPPAVCGGTNLTLPTFSGSVTVAGGGIANLPGVPIALKDNGTNQDACENFTYHFLYSGTAQYTDATSTVLTSSPNPSASGHSVTFTATVTANNTSSDPSLPSGTVTFYKCPTAACGTTTSLGTGTIGAGGKATFSTSSLPVGTTYVEAVYPGASTNFTGSTSNVVAQVVTGATIGTTTALTSTPNPSALGNSVYLTATVTKTSGSGTPTGTVRFYLGSTSNSPIGTGTLNSSGKATFVTSSLPAGTDHLYAIYAGDTNFSGSTSPVRFQVVIGPPGTCTGSYSNSIIGNPFFPFINGTNGNDFIYAVGGDYALNGHNGNDCLVAGNGDNRITDGNGNDVVITGNDESAIWVGNGNDQIIVGNGSNSIITGNGIDSVTAGNGSGNRVIVGNGADSVAVGSGSHNTVSLGSGADIVTITTPGGHETINGGSGNETIHLGGGTYNTYKGGKGKNTCHLPTPPSSWHGMPAAYYHDTITNCTVVTP